METTTFETPTTDDSLPTSKPAEDTITLTPVPPEDIMACAKPKCSLCYGLGKLTIKEVGGEKSEVSVCNCAIKRFVAQNRGRLAVSRDKKIFYRQVPESLAGSLPETESCEESSVSVMGNEDANSARFRVIKERIASLDAELADIAKRYDLQRKDRQTFLQAVEADLEKQQEGWKGNIEARKILESSLRRYDLRLDEWEKDLQLMRLERATTNDLLVAADETLSTMRTALAPYHQAVDKAKEDVANLEKKKHQAMKPTEQRKASLLKRMQHKAASLGMSITDIDSKLGCPEAETHGTAEGM